MVNLVLVSGCTQGTTPASLQHVPPSYYTRKLPYVLPKKPLKGKRSKEEQSVIIVERERDSEIEAIDQKLKEVEWYTKYLEGLNKKRLREMGK